MILPPEFDSRKWAHTHFADCPLNDPRRSQRLEQLAQQVADRPAASIPTLAQTWKDTKAIYRLLERPEATLHTVTATHRQLVQSQPGRFLIVSDTTHVDFGSQRNLPDAGPVGPGKSRGFLLHSGLLIDTSNDALVGLAGQVAHVRRGKKKGKQNDSQRLKRWRESEMWVELFEQVGSPPPAARYIHVCDSAADNFETMCTARRLGCDFVIRAGRMQRHVLIQGEKKPLAEAVKDFREEGHFDLEIPQGNGRRARTASMRASWGSVEILVPGHRSARVKEHVNRGAGNLKVQVVVIEEVAPPAGEDPISWILLTTLEVESLQEALEVKGFYENRWWCEEWHKGLKTGTRLACRQLQRVDRLLPLTGVLSVVAVLLVQLKSAARVEPETSARERVPLIWLKLLKAKEKIETLEISMYELWRAIAKLGGFLGRRHDGEPGWQTIWRGWKELHTLAVGVELAKTCG